ncbi:MAG: SPOR domain-containing protein [bacterium]
MRASPVVVTFALIGLFVLSLGIGYFVGERFLKPAGLAGQTQPPAPAATPRAAPPTVPATTPPIVAPATPAVAATPRPTAPPAPVVPPPTTVPTARPSPAVGGVLWRVQAGAFLKRENAQERVNQLDGAGFDAYILPAGGLFKVFVGAFADRANAEELSARLRALGFETLIVRQ